MNPLLLALLPKALEFATECLKEGKPVVETMIEMAKASDDPAAKAQLAKLRAAYDASDIAADEALQRVIDAG